MPKQLGYLVSQMLKGSSKGEEVEVSSNEGGKSAIGKD
jgi:hypothetical protein